MATRLIQILLNLLNTAVKFTDEGEVVLTVFCFTPDAGVSETALFPFAVRDTGIGIPPDRMNTLFRSFSQVDASTTRRYAGTGLGLVITKRLVVLMDIEMPEMDGVTAAALIRRVVAGKPRPYIVARPRMRLSYVNVGIMMALSAALLLPVAEATGAMFWPSPIPGGPELIILALGAAFGVAIALALGATFVPRKSDGPHAQARSGGCRWGSAS